MSKKNKNQKTTKYKVGNIFRSLPNYKEMHKQTAEKKGCAAAFSKARTLTQAKKILWGRGSSVIDE